MADEGFKRKLAAILSADVVGYSRLMDDNEEATIRTLKACRNTLTDKVVQYRGRVVDNPGDNILADFSSIVDAVNCAVEVQREFAEQNAEIPEEHRMLFRIGVNLGDVVEDEGRIYGDGVNIAARVESFAEAGGICISGRAYDQVENKIDLEYENLGEHQVKNIRRPIRLYRVLSLPGAAAHRVVKAKKVLGKKYLKLTMIITTAVALLLVGGLTVVWSVYFRLPAIDLSPDRKRDFALPHGLSIAVLPFVNLSGDPEQKYFSDGLTENIITSLSKSPDFLVIASYSAFTYRNKFESIQKAARDLGVQYVVDGSVQKEKGRVRISVRLTDGLSGRQLWAERYDRKMGAIFELQDDITLGIAEGLEVTLTESEMARLKFAGHRNLEVYNKWLKAMAYFRLETKEGNARCRKEAEEIIASAPESPGPYILIAATHIKDVALEVSESVYRSFALANTSLKKAKTLDNENSYVYVVLGGLYINKNEYEKAIASYEHAIYLNPNNDYAYAGLGLALSISGRPIEGVEFLEKSIRLNPYPPNDYYIWLGIAHRLLGEYEKAITAYTKIIDRMPDHRIARVSLVISYSLAGLEKKAHAEAEEVLRIDPNFTVENYAKANLAVMRKDDAMIGIRALKKAGLK